MVYLYYNYIHLIIYTPTLSQEMFYLLLLQDAKHRLAVGGVVHILASEKSVHQEQEEPACIYVSWWFAQGSHPFIP